MCIEKKEAIYDVPKIMVEVIHLAKVIFCFFFVLLLPKSLLAKIDLGSYIRKATIFCLLHVYAALRVCVL